MRVDADIVAFLPIQTFGDHRHALGHIGNEPDLVRPHVPQPSEPCSGTFDLDLLAGATGHAVAFVLGVLAQCVVVPVEKRCLPGRADMRNPGRDAKIGGIEQRVHHPSGCVTVPAVIPPSMTSV